jgi:hypothetical protein
MKRRPHPGTGTLIKLMEFLFLPGAFRTGYRAQRIHDSAHGAMSGIPEIEPVLFFSNRQ